MIQDELKKVAAKAAIKYVIFNDIIGVGTGSTTNFFIDELAKVKSYIKGAVASSIATAVKLKSYGIPIFDLNQVKNLSVYIDSADEITSLGMMIKGGGGALTCEKIIASVAQKFICIADSSKFVNILGKFPLPIEVIPMATTLVSKKVSALGCKTRVRMKNKKPWITDQGCHIIDAIGLRITAPVNLETEINNIVGVVTVGLFAKQSASICLLGTPTGVQIIKF